MTSSNQRGNRQKLEHGKFHTTTGKNFFTVRAVEHWNGLPREVVESPMLEVFKEHLDIAFMDIV